ncbi:hypothetical protein [Morganella morganii IS15]|nr:hypothetical protein [Morganella morganii IS15]
MQTYYFNFIHYFVICCCLFLLNSGGRIKIIIRPDNLFRTKLGLR